MNIKLNNILTFVAGAAIGAVATWKFVEKKYERIAQEEINAVKEFYREREERSDMFAERDDYEEDYLNAESERCEEIREGVLMGGTIDTPIIPQEYKDIVSNYAETEVDPMVDKPYIIPPSEYGDIDEYECISLNYYTDGVVADDFDKVVEDIEGTIGSESLKHFGEYEDDCVFVRNDTRRCDYEICRDTRAFSEVYTGSEDE